MWCLPLWPRIFMSNMMPRMLTPSSSISHKCFRKALRWRDSKSLASSSRLRWKIGRSPLIFFIWFYGHLIKLSTLGFYMDNELSMVMTLARLNDRCAPFVMIYWVYCVYKYANHGTFTQFDFFSSLKWKGSKKKQLRGKGSKNRKREGW